MFGAVSFADDSLDLRYVTVREQLPSRRRTPWSLGPQANGSLAIDKRTNELLRERARSVSQSPSRLRVNLILRVLQ